jgi:hypothetical protein
VHNSLREIIIKETHSVCSSRCCGSGPSALPHRGSGPIVVLHRLPPVNETWRNRCEPNLKITRFIVYKFKILKIIKISKNTIKKTRTNSNHSGEEFFSNLHRLDG